MNDTDKVIDTAECVNIVRDLVEAFAAKGMSLQYGLRNEYDPETVYRSPWTFEISTELVGRGLKALGLPAPEVPKAKKIPAVPTEAQARTLGALASHPDARLESAQGWSYRSYYTVERPGDNGDGPVKLTDVASGTYDKLLAYKWIVYERQGEGYRPSSYYRLTDAGREALERYKVKAAAAPASSTA